MPSSNDSASQCASLGDDVDPLIRYEGQWSRTEKESLHGAIEAYEGRHSDPVGHTPNWVLVAVRIPDQPQFIASRHGWQDIVRADTPEHLAHRVRNLTDGCMKKTELP
ncbi:hypothetical protein CRI94_13660 [Longibacter salinarum]|uniref:Uncharacterized protein n=1 Tax=Longibacter salinarum TaxID=1850348 RepID=A0A2A8CVD1_9BACT|nr:hypothetical protein [Longibacter salinarum]PEN12563.1 hypothetical protein CRI94_13660 [Longibacter salinarum]